ncbi:hypothetical protein [Intestinirhabdus alba]
MNRCILLNQTHRSDVRSSHLFCISALHSCRCYTHFGASQDFRAGNGG